MISILKSNASNLPESWLWVWNYCL